MLIYKVKQSMMKKKYKKSLHVLEDGASGMQVVVINQVIAQILIIIW